MSRVSASRSSASWVGSNRSTAIVGVLTVLGEELQYRLE
jgi:hypothetical protein